MKFTVKFILWCVLMYGCWELGRGYTRAIFYFAAQDRTPPTPIRVNALTIEPRTELNGSLTSLVVTAHIQRVETLPNGEAHVTTLGRVSFDLVRDQGEVTVSGNKRTYNQLATALYQAALQEWDDVTHGAEPQPLSQLPESRVRK